MIQNAELNLELLNISGLQGKKRGVSSPRDAMFTNNTGQMLAVNGADRRRHKTMAEYRFGEATFKIHFPVDAEIIRIIPRFPKMGGENAIEHNPMTLIIYEDYHTKEVDILEVPEYHSLHQHYGFEYKRNEEVWETLTSRSSVLVPKGTVVADSPLITSDGDYKFGLEIPSLLVSDPGGAEDGFVISEDVVQRIIPTGFGKRVLSIGSKQFPLNLYGNLWRYKIMADIGETINPDGLVFAARKYDELLSPVGLKPANLQRCNIGYDYCVYGEANATVIDISVERNTSLSSSQMPTGMDEQLFKYYNADIAYYTRILETYMELYRRKGLKISDAFHELVVDAIGRVGKEYFSRNRDKFHESIVQKVHKVFQSMPLDEWRVEVTFKYSPVPNVGFKLTDTHGARRENPPAAKLGWNFTSLAA